MHAQFKSSPYNLICYIPNMNKVPSDAPSPHRVNPYPPSKKRKTSLYPYGKMGYAKKTFTQWVKKTAR